MWLQFTLPLTGEVVIPVQNEKKYIMSLLKRLYELNLNAMSHIEEGKTPFMTKQRQNELHISRVADQACLRGL